MRNAGRGDGGDAARAERRASGSPAQGRRPLVQAPSQISKQHCAHTQDAIDAKDETIH